MVCSVMMINSCSQVHLQLRRCTAAASAVATDYVQRFCVAGRSMSDVTWACDSRRVRMPTCALMLSAALVPTAFCAPMLRIPADHRSATLARPAGSSRAHGSSPLQRAERCSWHLLSCCGGGSHAGFAVIALFLLNADLHEQNLVHVLCWCCVCDVCK